MVAGFPCMLCGVQYIYSCAMVDLLVRCLCFLLTVSFLHFVQVEMRGAIMVASGTTSFCVGLPLLQARALWW